MQNKREIVVKKIDNFVFNTKIINIITAVFAVLFAILFCLTSSIINKRNAYYQQMFDHLVEANQLDSILTATTNAVENDNSSTESQKPMFNNAKSAAIFAFSKLYNYKMYDIEATGITISSAAGQNVEIDMRSRYAKFESGMQLTQTFRVETRTNFGQSGAVEIVYSNGKRYERNGSNLRESSGKLTSDFSGKYALKNSMLSQQPFYLVNDKSVVDDIFFSYEKDFYGRIKCYYATVAISTTYGIADYAQDIKEQGGTSLPSFSKVELSCILDCNGDLVSFTSNEEMTLVKTIVINITANTKNNINYVILSHDKTPTLAQPTL